MNYWEKLLEGFSFKSKGGAPDFTNPNDRMLLRMELLKRGWNKGAVNNFLYEIDLVRKKQPDGSYGSDYPVKQFNPDRGQRLVKKDASAQDVKTALGVKDDDDLQKGKDEKPQKDERGYDDTPESKEEDRYLEFATEREDGEELPDDIDLGMGKPASTAGEATVVKGMKQAVKTWRAQFGNDKQAWESLSYEDKKNWLRNNFLSKFRAEMLQKAGSQNEKGKWENNKETYLEPEWVESSINSIERMMIKDENKNSEAIGIENVKEIGWDTTNGRKHVGIKGENDKAAEEGAGDMFISTKDGSVVALSLKKDGNVAIANKTYKQEFPKVLESMRSEMLESGMDKGEVDKILNEFQDTAGLQVWQKGIQDAQTTLSSELKEKSNTRTNLINTIDRAKDLYTRGMNGDRQAEQDFKKLTGKSTLRAGYKDYLKPFVGDSSTWEGKTTEQQLDEYLQSGKLETTAKHAKGILRFVVNDTPKDDPNYTRSRELYNNFRQWEHKLSDKMYDFIGKSPENEKAFKNFLLNGVHLGEVLGFKDSGGVDDFKVLFGSNEKGEGTNELGSMMDLNTFTGLFFGDGEEKDKVLSLIGQARDTKDEKERKELQEEVMEMVRGKLSVDYATKTIGVKHENGYYPLFNTKARSRGLPTPPQLEILHTDYTAKALQHGWNPESWPFQIQKNFYSKLKKEAQEDLKALTADGSSYTQKEYDVIQKRIDSLDDKIKSMKK